MYVLCALCGLAMLRAPLQSPFASQPQKSPHITRNLIESLYGLRTLAVPMQSKARESLPIFCHLCSLLIPCEPMQSPFAPQPQKSPPCHKTLCSLNSSRKTLQSSYELKRKSLRLLFCACSLHSYKIPMQSPYIAPTLKSHHIARAYQSPFAPCTSAVLV